MRWSVVFTATLRDVYPDKIALHLDSPPTAQKRSAYNERTEVSLKRQWDAYRSLSHSTQAQQPPLTPINAPSTSIPIIVLMPLLSWALYLHQHRYFTLGRARLSRQSRRLSASGKPPGDASPRPTSYSASKALAGIFANVLVNRTCVPLPDPGLRVSR
ncbi:hypothetical protein BC939DRAFT_55206 [Gamsiella multidivaricata]|uniref:uncharacterized protein n=1 Tax=Gamsiella multidivaricata TaxID=101098 RepID=UPI00221F2A4D|nr:uncharacterized protein BC939DRAFT_55206 [Gamsiella multidivaricata]KAI7816247.1 hypothetical protein BC939DRAFT_55206 [Gamsiella multidivaricata]